MRAMVLESARLPLREVDLPPPRPGPEQILIQVRACGVCRTDLHVVDGELTEPKLPLVPGHEIVGIVVEKGKRVERFDVGQRSASPGWASPAAPAAIAKAVGKTSATRPVSPATKSTAATRSIRWPISATPSLCRPRMGMRRRRRSCARTDRLPLPGNGRRGPAPRPVWVRCRGPHHHPGGTASGPRSIRLHAPRRFRRTAFARDLGAVWAGGSDVPPPEELDAAILFAPVGSLVPRRCGRSPRAASSSVPAST